MNTVNRWLNSTMKEVVVGNKIINEEYDRDGQHVVRALFHFLIVWLILWYVNDWIEYYFQFEMKMADIHVSEVDDRCSELNRLAERVSILESE